MSTSSDPGAARPPADQAGLSSEAPPGADAVARSGPLGVRDLGNPLVLIALGGGCGLSPVAPGTVGSLLGVALWWLLLADLPLFVRAALALACLVGGTVVVHALVARRRLGDEPAIVVDEIVGVWIALLPLQKSLLWVTAALVLFRLLDITKPWPLKWVERTLPGGVGVMADDALAGAVVAVAVAVALALTGSG